MPSAIRAQGLTKHYGRVVGLEDLSLDVHEGEVFGFLGPNGAGKTTTIRLLLDLVRPTAGAAWILGFHCRTQGIEARQRIGYLPGELPVYSELDGRSFLDYLTAVGRRAVASRTLDHLLRRFAVSEFDLRRPMRDYSHGMKRKLGIIQALAPEPPLLILDEPTSGLDPLMIEAFAETIHELKTAGRTTVFLSSHVLSEVEKTCDRVALVRRGKLATVQTLDAIREAMPRRVTVSFTAPVERAIATDGVVTLVSQSPRTSVFEVRGPMGPLITSLAGLPIDDVHVEQFTLEDYVLRFYAGSDA